MRSKPLQLGIIGGGIDSAVGLTHKISAQLDGRWCIGAGCFSTYPRINQETGTTWSVDKDRIHTDWKTLLVAEKEAIDAVLVLTPTPTHAEIVIAAIEHGYPVICEKALAASVRDAGKIREAVEKHKAYLAVTYNYTGYPMLRELQRLIGSGRLGRLNQIHVEMPQEGFARLDKEGHKMKPQAWRLEDHEIPTLSLDLGVHIHHIIHFLTGEHPIEVVATNNTFGFFQDVVDNTLCIAHYTGGLRSQIWFGKAALGHSNGLRVRIYGSEGSAEWYQLQPETLVLSDNKGIRKTIERSTADLLIAHEARYNRFKAGHPAGFIEAFANLYQDLADSLLEYKTSGEISSLWMFDVHIAEKGLMFLEAIAASADQRCWRAVQQP